MAEESKRCFHHDNTSSLIHRAITDAANDSNSSALAALSRGMNVLHETENEREMEGSFVAFGLVLFALFTSRV